MSKSFDIDALLNDEHAMFDSIDDTKIIVDGLEASSTEPTKVNFDALEVETESSDEEIEEDEDEGEEEKNGGFKSDVTLNPKVNKKIQNEIKQLSASKKRKANDTEDENEIYEAENIPRTKKMQKLNAKKKIKKEKRNGNYSLKFLKMLNELVKALYCF